MARKKVEDTVINEDETASAATLHAQSGSASGVDEGSGFGGDNGEKSRFEQISAIMGYLGKVDKSTLKYFTGMIASHSDEALSKAVGDWSGKNRDTIKAKASDAVGKEAGGGPSAFGDQIAKKESGIRSFTPSKFGQPDPTCKEAIKQELSTMLGEAEGLTDEFKSKAATIFEAALELRVAEERAKVEDAFDAALAEEVQTITEALEDKVATYIEYVAEEWMKDNEVAIESALRSEITTEFMTKLRDLFIESNINIPEDQIDVVDTLATKVEELEERLANAINEVADLRRFKEVTDREQIVSAATEGLTLAAAEKLKKLSENVEADDAEDFVKKVNILKESLSPTKKESTVQALMEDVSEDNAPPKDEYAGVTPEMKRYLQALGR